jgi:hypothetical protein
MHKIFKYKVEELNGKFFTFMPDNAILIRMGDVHDDFYDGSFIWAIVNTKDKRLPREVDYREWSANPRPDNFGSLNSVQLRIKEKQETDLTLGTPVYAQDIDGKLWLYMKPSFNPFPKGSDFKKYKIVFYKTGQEITEDVSKLKYLGLCRLWIMQELGLYTFLVEE